MKFKNAEKLRLFEIRNSFSIALLIMIFAIFNGFSQELEDTDITLAVEDALSYEEGVNELLIDVATLNQRMTAEDIAYDVGAEWGKNQIDVVGLLQINPEKPTK
jgi:hypothetical protein